MRDMKNIIRYALMICLGAGLVGCEWEGSGDENSWNSRYNFVNFSGNYRGQGGGGLLVSQYTGTSVASSSTEESSFVTVVGESDGSRSIPETGAQILFTGRTDNYPLKPGSFSLLLSGAGAGSFTDDETGNLKGSAVLFGIVAVNGTGTIKYDTGEWAILLNPPGVAAPSGSSVSIALSYVYEANNSAPSSGGVTPGSTKVSIYAFNVIQEGNKLRIVDNNGSVYEGGFGSIRSTSGTDQDTSFPTYADGDQVMGQFEASGRSAANIGVKMVGNFQATIAGVSSSSGGTTSMRLTDRRILGTWIEVGGKTGDLNGQAVPIVVSTTTTTTP
jgi:hypothetical protein